MDKQILTEKELNDLQDRYPALLQIDSSGQLATFLDEKCVSYEEFDDIVQVTLDGGNRAVIFLNESRDLTVFIDAFVEKNGEMDYQFATRHVFSSDNMDGALRYLESFSTAESAQNLTHLVETTNDMMELMGSKDFDKTFAFVLKCENIEIDNGNYTAGVSHAIVHLDNGMGIEITRNVGNVGGVERPTEDIRIEPFCTNNSGEMRYYLSAKFEDSVYRDSVIDQALELERTGRDTSVSHSSMIAHNETVSAMTYEYIEALNQTELGPSISTLNGLRSWDFHSVDIGEVAMGTVDRTIHSLGADKGDDSSFGDISIRPFIENGKFCLEVSEMEEDGLKVIGVKSYDVETFDMADFKSSMREVLDDVVRFAGEEKDIDTSKFDEVTTNNSFDLEID